MTNVTIIKDVANRKTGDSIDVSPGAASFLINAGYAEAVTAKADQPKRTRRTAAQVDDDDKGERSEVD